MNNQSPQLGTIRDYILKYFPDTLWWDGFNKHEKFNPARAYKHRQGLPNEIRIEFDGEDKQKNMDAVVQVGFRLTELGYSFAIFQTEGGRSPHIHIYDLDELELLDSEQRTLYREKFMDLVCGEFDGDKELCEEKHLCALEFANHFKYNKPKKLVGFVDNGFNSGIELDIKLDVLHGRSRKAIPVRKKIKFGDMIMGKGSDIIIQNCSFEKVFDKYGMKYKGHMALCPFHNDTNYSLSFSNEKGLWKCFGSGCDSSGNVFSLIKMLRELK